MLGPTRAADYERATDSTYVQASRILYRLQLPAENAAKIYAVQQDTRKQQQALTQDANLTSSDRIDRLARLHAEATAQLLPLLGGERGLAIYRQNSGYWINALEPLRPPRK